MFKKKSKLSMDILKILNYSFRKKFFIFEEDDSIIEYRRIKNITSLEIHYQSLRIHKKDTKEIYKSTIKPWRRKFKIGYGIKLLQSNVFTYNINIKELNNLLN